MHNLYQVIINSFPYFATLETNYSFKLLVKFLSYPVRSSSDGIPANLVLSPSSLVGCRHDSPLAVYWKGFGHPQHRNIYMPEVLFGISLWTDGVIQRLHQVINFGAKVSGNNIESEF